MAKKSWEKLCISRRKNIHQRGNSKYVSISKRVCMNLQNSILGRVKKKAVDGGVRIMVERKDKVSKLKY